MGRLMDREQFFYEHAGYSYDPKTETKEQGRRRSARALARAEQLGRELDFCYAWERDDLTNEEFSGEKPYYYLWRCRVHKFRNPEETLASVCGVDFGRDGYPWNDPYSEVVEADLALEILSRQA